MRGGRSRGSPKLACMPLPTTHSHTPNKSKLYSILKSNLLINNIASQVENITFDF